MMRVEVPDTTDSFSSGSDWTIGFRLALMGVALMGVAFNGVLFKGVLFKGVLVMGAICSELAIIASAVAISNWLTGLEAGTGEGPKKFPIAGVATGVATATGGSNRRSGISGSVSSSSSSSSSPFPGFCRAHDFVLSDGSTPSALRSWTYLIGVFLRAPDTTEENLLRLVDVSLP